MVGFVPSVECDHMVSFRGSDDDDDSPFDPEDFSPSPIDPFSAQRQLELLMEQITVARPVTRSLFTFGDTEMPYVLILKPGQDGQAEVVAGEIKVTRPTILTPDRQPEFFGFFEELAAEAGGELADYVQFALRRTAAFDRLRVSNVLGLTEKPGGGVEEVLDRVTRRLDDEEDEDTAVLISPRKLGPLAVLKYASDRISNSAADNVQELRERGFLPD